MVPEVGGVWYHTIVITATCVTSHVEYLYIILCSLRRCKFLLHECNNWQLCEIITQGKACTEMSYACTILTRFQRQLLLWYQVGLRQSLGAKLTLTSFWRVCSQEVLPVSGTQISKKRVSASLRAHKTKSPQKSQTHRQTANRYVGKSGTLYYGLQGGPWP